MLKVQTERNNHVDDLSQREGSMIQTIVYLPIAFQVFYATLYLLVFLKMGDSSIGATPALQTTSVQ